MTFKCCFINKLWNYTCDTVNLIYDSFHHNLIPYGKDYIKKFRFLFGKKRRNSNCYIVEFFYIYWYWKKPEYYTDMNYCYVLINLMYPNESVYKNCKIPQHKFCGICMVRIGLPNSVSLSHWFTIWC